MSMKEIFLFPALAVSWLAWKLNTASCQNFEQFFSRTHLISCSRFSPQCQPSDLTSNSLLSVPLQSYPPLSSNLGWFVELEKLTVVVMAEKLKHIVEEQEVHTMGVSASRRGLGDFSS